MNQELQDSILQAEQASRALCEHVGRLDTGADDITQALAHRIESGPAYHLKPF
jgi:hypothetical protein